ncbi:hypothetical protein ASPVEDRAFT_47969 [Aspergillus versicolor CBS 583.65]|uniref:Uncharacterized protein n=1 Tax=Aspergillus versicolor CBS 583.65 TaxID=1036611 RepID=A0A1L9Q4W0_ASPVE|nr:uncharacterized protein ASPVEDRAFT_47969 [Aspergillus versicolor CBS 583.65]OJJ08813.1 hypothetical protein ASPVEDRAFT_47969 [Aspergillus versicolor CBS 583.65]
MAQRKYFILDKLIDAGEIDSFLGRVVETKSQPLARFAPCRPLTPEERPHNTNDIIPGILPEPSVSINRKETIQIFREKGISGQLSALLGFDIMRGSSETRQLESELVKQYTLSNPVQYFETLMHDQDYAQDVRALLETTKSHHAYLVTGFLTAVRATWTITSGTNTANSLGVNIPLSTLINVPVPGLLDFSFQPRISSGAQHTRELSSDQEEIFAVSYSVVEWKHRGVPLPGFGIKAPVLGRPKRAKAYHLALGHDDGSSEEIELDSDEESIEAGGWGATPVKVCAEVLVNSTEMEREYLSSELVSNFQL